MPRSTFSLALLLLAGCSPHRPAGTVDAALPVAGIPESLTYQKELRVDLTSMTHTPSGLYYTDEQVGSGAEAKAGGHASVHYSGWLVNGEQFDSSLGGSPLTFGVGNGEVIQGWDEGVTGMKVGGRRKLVIPPALGYGAAGSGGAIPPNATLVFDVELIDVR